MTDPKSSDTPTPPALSPTDEESRCATECFYGKLVRARFSSEDVKLLEKLTGANHYEPGDNFGVIDEELTPDESRRLASLASRIASLLPPEAP